MNTEPDAAHESLMTLLEIAMKNPPQMPDFIPPLAIPSTPPDGPNPYFKAFQPYQAALLKPEALQTTNQYTLRFAKEALDELKRTERVRISGSYSDGKVTFRKEAPEGIYNGTVERRDGIIFLDETLHTNVSASDL